MKTKVTNLMVNGRAVANQFEIFYFDNCGDVEKVVFQSYDSIICEFVIAPLGDCEASLIIGRDWDYSRTTMKHLYNFLRGYMFNISSKKDIEKAIKNGYIEKLGIKVAVANNENLY